MVALRDLSLKASGVYTCEVSSEAPRFKTSSSAGSMQVMKFDISSMRISKSVDGAAKSSLVIQSSLLIPGTSNSRISFCDHPS